VEPELSTGQDWKGMSVMYGLLAWDLVKARREEIARTAERAHLERTARPRKRRTSWLKGR
jgi:hypothetical protein